MRKKKKGSTLIVVVIIFMFITCVSVGMLSLTAGNYSARISESKRIENLYSSESGLDNAYNIMVKTFNAAAQYGNYSVTALKKGNDKSPNNSVYLMLKKDKEEQEEKIENAKKIINDSSSDKDEIKEQKKIIAKCTILIEEIDKAFDVLENEEFKRAFKEFIYSDDDKYNTNILSKCIDEKKIVASIDGINANDISFAAIKFNNETKGKIRDGSSEKIVNLPYLTADILLNNSVTSKIIELKAKNGHSDDIKINITENDEYTIALESMFKTTSKNTVKIGENIKTVQAIYTMKVPEYNDVFYGSGSVNIDEYPVLRDNGILVGKDMNVNVGTSGDKGLTVKSDVFVEGQEKDQIRNKVIDKYYGGISIKNSKNVSFNENVITRGTFNLQSNTEGEIKGDLYAKNVHIGSINSDSILSELKNTFDFKDVILDNDFSVKADDTDITMENFYGINDKNTDKSSEINNSEAGKERTSSSIIINSISDTSSILIKNKAYIMGVAHIDTKSEYSTGESIGVKGNYAAYSVPLNKHQTFDYDEPLYLLKEGNVFEKADHFNEYWHNRLDKINKSGIIFEKPEDVYSIGALVYKDNNGDMHIKNSNYSNEKDDEIEKLRKDYASNVYMMGKEADISDYNSLGKDAVRVENMIDFSILSKDKDNELYYDLKQVLSQGGDMFIINDTEAPITIDSDTYGEKINAVIVSKGDVNISGDITIYGNIITCGNLNIGDGNIIIEHSPELIKNIQGRYYKIYSQLLSGFKDYGTEIEKKEDNIGITNGDSDNYMSNYDVNSFLKNNIWKIVR